MSKEGKLIKNTAIVSIGKICTQLISFFLLPLYTAYLSTIEYGVVDLLNTLVSLLIPLVMWKLEDGIFRFLIDNRDKKDEQKNIISSVFMFVIIQLTVVVGLFLIASRFINNEYKYYLLINLIANAFANLFLQISRGVGDNVNYSIGSFLSGLMTVVLNVYFIVSLKLGAYGMLLAVFIGNMTTIIYMFFAKRLYKYISFKSVDKKTLKEIIRYSIPLIPNAISWWVVNASDRLIVTSLLGVDINGIYSVANKFPNVVVTIFNIFNITWAESAAVNYKEKDREEYFSKIWNFTISFFGSLCLGLIAILPIVFNLMVNTKFADAYFQIPILTVATMLNILVSFLGAIYIAKKLTKEIAKTSFYAAIINITTHLLLIKYIGLYAASVSTLISWTAMLIYRYVDSKKYIKLKTDYKNIVIIFLMLIAEIVTYYINYKILNYCMFAFTLFAIMILNKNNIKYIFTIIKNKINK